MSASDREKPSSAKGGFVGELRLVAASNYCPGDRLDKVAWRITVPLKRN